MRGFIDEDRIPSRAMWQVATALDEDDEALLADARRSAASCAYVETIYGVIPAANWKAYHH